MSKQLNVEQAIDVDGLTKLYKDPLQKSYELSSYNGYRIFYLEPGDGYNIGSLFAFPQRNEDKKYREMIVRQNINSKTYDSDQKEAVETIPQIQKLIDDSKDTVQPVFMPMLPSEAETGKSFQSLDEQAVKDNSKYEKISKQISNAFDMARIQIMRLTGKDVPEKWFLYGRGENCKGLFRLWSLCPDKTSAICCDDNIDDIVLPITSHKNKDMSYPNGFENYEEITGKSGNDSELLSQYRNTDVLYIGKGFDLEKQKHENQVKSKLKKLKFPSINIERYDGTRKVDFAYFYQFRNEIYNKKSVIGNLLKRLIHAGKSEGPLLLTAGEPVVDKESDNKLGPLSQQEMQDYQRNLFIAAQGSSSRTAKNRLARVISSDERALGE